MNSICWRRSFSNRFAQLLAAAAILLSSAGGARAFVIELVNLGGVDTGSAVEWGFQQAAAFWESVLKDDATVRIDVGFAPLGTNVLGEAGSTSFLQSYGLIRTALLFDATSPADTTAVASLPNTLGRAWRTTDPLTGDPFLDDDTSNNNRFLDINRANAKALGLTLQNGVTDLGGGTNLVDSHDTSLPDGSLVFSSQYVPQFDFDRTDGISPGMLDFVGIVIHEIGHVLGFVSGVDIVDGTAAPNTFPTQNPPPPQIDPIPLDNFAVFSILDLFRYSTESLLLGEGVLDGHQGAEAYFSIDGGATNMALFSTGPLDGDGRQASHWKDSPTFAEGIGIMDPTAQPPGRLNVVTDVDLLAFDAIGYDLVPEPNCMALLLCGLGIGLWNRR